MAMGVRRGGGGQGGLLPAKNSMLLDFFEKNSMFLVFFSKKYVFAPPLWKKVCGRPCLWLRAGLNNLRPVGPYSPKFCLFSLLFTWKHFSCVKIYMTWPFKKKIWPSMEFKFCTLCLREKLIRARCFLTSCHQANWKLTMINLSPQITQLKRLSFFHLLSKKIDLMDQIYCKMISYIFSGRKKMTFIVCDLSIRNHRLILLTVFPARVARSQKK